MSKKTILILSFTLIFLGAILFGGAMTMLKWDFKMLSTVKYQTNEHTVTEEFTEILISTDTARVVLEPSEDGRVSVVCHERIKAPHSVSVEGGVLRIEITDKRKWYEHIGLDLDAPTITVKIPEGEYGALTLRSKTGGVSVARGFTFASASVKTSTGSIRFAASVRGTLTVKASTGGIKLENLSTDSLDLSVSTGSITVSNATVTHDVHLDSSTGKTNLTALRCRDLISEGDTGDVSLTDVIASGKLKLETDTGSILLSRCDAAEIEIETDTGNVVGTLLCEKLFDAKSDTGRVTVPEPVGTSPCKIRTDTGNIKIELAN